MKSDRQNKKVVLYSTLQFLSLGGKLYDSEGNLIRNDIRMDVTYRNEFPRFVVTHNPDETIPYFERTKNIPMSAQILLYVVNAILGINKSVIVVKYPNYDSDEREPIEIARIWCTGDTDDRVLHISFDGLECRFVIEPENTFFSLIDSDDGTDVTSSKEFLGMFVKFYATSLKDTSVLAAMLYSKQSRYEKETK